MSDSEKKREFVKGEVCYIVIKVKNVDESINENKYYFMLCAVESFRRNGFRIMESMPFRKRGWRKHYGNTTSHDETIGLVELKDDEIFISSPSEMGIEGGNIVEDAKRLHLKINLQKYLGIRDEFL